MSAIKMIDDLKAKGAKIVAFSSVCGGLPAPEAANNPFGCVTYVAPQRAASVCVIARALIFAVGGGSGHGGGGGGGGIGERGGTQELHVLPETLCFPPPHFAGTSSRGALGVRCLLPATLRSSSVAAPL
jgi:hypothetical protein